MQSQRVQFLYQIKLSSLLCAILLLFYLSMTHTFDVFFIRCRHFIQFAHIIPKQNNAPAVALRHSGSICVAEFNWCNYVCLKLDDNDHCLKIVRR